MKTHEELILGDSVATILAKSDEMNPVISEYQFQRDVLDILVNPFGQETLRRYMTYVGELTKPLNVLDNEDPSKILFTVPALVQSPNPTVSTANGFTADGFMRSLTRDIELGGRAVHEKILAFMTQITHTPNYLEVVIKPIQVILQRYGRVMIDLPGVESTPLPAGPTPTGGPVTDTSFVDEYDD